MKRNTVLFVLMLWTLSLVFITGCSTDTDKDTSQQETPKTETVAETPPEATSETKSASEEKIASETKVASETSAPQLTIPEAVFEFKPVLENAYVIHKFRVQNKGTAELRIAKVRSG